LTSFAESPRNRFQALRALARWLGGRDERQQLAELGFMDKLLAEQRQSLVRTFGQMALRQVRQAPITKETSDDERSDDERGVRIGTPCHAA
jgi:hypothetical protein